MFKKIVFTFLILLTLYSTCVVAYRIFEPRDNISQNTTTNYLAYESLESYVKEGSQNTHYLFFYSQANNDCIYVHDTLFPLVENDIGVSLDSLIEMVDITEVDETLETTELFQTWSINAYPAFVCVKVDNGEMTTSNKLEWSSEKPFSVQSIEEWLSENGLYTPNK